MVHLLIPLFCNQMLKASKNIRISNINKLIFGHANSLRNKFDILSKQIKDSIDIIMVSETKLDGFFPEGQFLIKDFYSPFRFDRNRMVEELCFTYGETSQPSC